MMARRRVPAQRPTRTLEAAVWIDHDEAVIVEHGTGPDDEKSVEVLVRGPAEDETLFEVRTIDEVLDEPRVVVSGPSDARLEFERAYVALTHRPDRLVDRDPSVDLDPRTAIASEAGRTS